MKYIFVNLKRFDISPSCGGVNTISHMSNWGSYIVKRAEEELSGIDQSLSDVTFPIFFPEAHLLNAIAATSTHSNIHIEVGSQGVHTCTTEKGGNFGAFTTYLPASAVKEIGATWTIIGHSEQRKHLEMMLSLVTDNKEDIHSAIHSILHDQIKMAQKEKLSVLYCIGEKSDEVERKEEVLKSQLNLAIQDDIDKEHLVLAYEPIWAIGPGKTPPSAEEIAKSASLIKKIISLPVVYGGGLKKENAMGIGSIEELDGGLIALTRFSGEIGFYPDEYKTIVELYMKGVKR